MPSKSTTQQKNIERITSLVSGVGDKLFGGKIETGFLYWGTELHLSETSDQPTEDDLTQNITDGKDDLGLDCYYIDTDENIVWLFQSKYRSEVGNIPHKEISDFLKMPRRLVDPLALKENINAKLLDFAPTFRTRIIEGFQLKLVYFTTNRNHKATDSEVQNWNQLPLCLTVGTNEIEVEHIAIISDLDDLLQRFESSISQSPVDTSIRFRSQSWHETESGKFKCLMATIELKELVKLFNTYKYAIFRDNPRGPLGAVRVNKAIGRTLEDKEMRKYFHLLNNGLSSTCHSYSTPIQVKDDENYCETNVRDFQIVNGCQTTYTIWDCWRRGNELEGAFVNLKLVEGQTLKDSISEASNAQTQMKDWDFVFGDKIQKRLQSEFKLLEPPVFYELRRGEFKYMTASDTEKVTVKDIAQTAWAAMGHPGEAKDKLREIPQSRTVNAGLYQAVFFKDSTASFYLLPWRVYQNVKSEHEKYVNETDEQGDYREYGRLHLVWLVVRGLVKLLGKKDVKDIKPQEAIDLVKQMSVWFDPLHTLAVDSIREVVKVEQKATEKAGKPLSLRQLFRNDSNYKDFADTFDEKWGEHKKEWGTISKELEV